VSHYSLTGRGRLQGEQADKVLANVVASFERAAAEVASHLPAWLWLNNLRGLPGEIFQNPAYRYAGSHIERRLRAEAIAALHGADADAPTPDWFPTEAFLRFVRLVNAETRATVLRRIAAKAVPLIFSADGWPKVDCSDSRWRALVVFDERSQEANDLDGIAGTRATYDLSELSNSRRNFNYIVGWGHRADTSERQLHAWEHQFEDVVVPDWLYAAYAYRTRVPDLMEGLPWATQEFLLDMIVQQACLFHVMEGSACLRVAVLRSGYFPISTEAWAGTLEELLGLEATREFADRLVGVELDGVSFDDLLAAARRPPQLNPYRPGPVTTESPDGVLVDVVTAAHRVSLGLAPTAAGGPVPDHRAHDFERQVQAVIDATSWRPPDELRRLIGKDLRLPDGTVLTDLDCLAVRDSTAIIIDAKSPAAPGLREGNFAATRNARTMLEEARDLWDAKVSKLRAHPVGASYDLSGIATLVPLVVTPVPVFVHEDLLGPRVLGALRPVASLGELSVFLGA